MEDGGVATDRFFIIDQELVELKYRGKSSGGTRDKAKKQ